MFFLSYCISYALENLDNVLTDYHEAAVSQAKVNDTRTWIPKREGLEG